jgi:hypothetical protein
VLKPAYKNEPHTHTNYQRCYNRKREQQGQPLLELRRVGAELDSNSVGPELIQERANEHSRRRQNSSIAETPPKADHHREPTNAAHSPESSTKVAQRGSRARSKPCRRSPNKESPAGDHPHHTIIGEQRVMGSKMVSSRRVRHKKMPAPPNPRILGFHPEHVEGRRKALTPSRKGRRPQKSPSWPKRARVSPRRNPSTFYKGYRPSRDGQTTATKRCSPAPRRPHGRGHWPAPEPLARPPTSKLPPSRAASRHPSKTHR